MSDILNNPFNFYRSSTCKLMQMLYKSSIVVHGDSPCQCEALHDHSSHGAFTSKLLANIFALRRGDMFS